MIIVVPSCLKDADGARTRSDQKQCSIIQELSKAFKTVITIVAWCSNFVEYNALNSFPGKMQSKFDHPNPYRPIA